ncbi:bifunctional diguanylate cyclase/phosphodiesterase [Actinotalea sp. K2]|uniref:putative bifunctional diguanylate cyclase/phosphodiesterase n=1 Tax=Actinotalea sp. K2 TaxID=2939438 RepID=UPI0020182BA6|nr:EAL domain-containing protein [Actinotalea sp. K2]MCL3861347.1 EAL domain-containing protein [Actinotalea sp. K2]
MPPHEDPRERTAPTRRPLSLTRRFALISLVGMALVGSALVTTTSYALRSQSLREAVAAAEAVATATRATVAESAYETGELTLPERTALRSVLADADQRVVSVRLWARDGTQVFDSTGAGDPAQVDTERLARATQDRIPGVTLRTHAPSGADPAAQDPGQISALEVHVPVSYAGRTVGAAQVVLDRTEALATERSALARVTAVVVAGLVLLWVVLFRTVRSASRRLQQTARENARLAMQDALTGLPNRRMLMSRLARSVRTSQAGGGGVGLLLLDIDRFKDINDSLGHDHGDQLLVQIARRLTETFRGQDVVARLGGDEFAVLLPGVESVEAAEALAQRARAVFAEPYRLGAMSLHVATSIGVATIPDHAHDAPTLMRRADVAMYTAKHHRRGVAVYSAADDDSSPARLVLQGELHRALTRTDELALHYQPKIDLMTGATVGFEALMRWHHPTRGEVEPSVFIPLAEQSGLIDDLTTFALRTAIAQLGEWTEVNPAPVAVNLSALSVSSADVVVQIQRLLAQHGVAPGRLEVEITETALVRDPTRVVPVLRRLAAIGVRVAIDDFGIGNTSIAQLRDLPVGVLKIDRLFVSDLSQGTDRPGSQAVIKAMVDLAHSFGMQVVAEGVEDGNTAARLLALGVDLAQGFWYSPAVAAHEAVDDPARRRTRTHHDLGATA